MTKNKAFTPMSKKRMTYEVKHVNLSAYVYLETRSDEMICRASLSLKSIVH